MSRIPTLAVLAGLMTLGVTAAALSDSDDGPGRLPQVTDAMTRKACSECHMAYPAQFLPPASWQAIMADLRNHFGTDAHFDPATTSAVATWLVAHSTPMAGIDPANPPLRITDMAWFTARHAGHSRGRAVGNGPDPMGNCMLCHNGMGSDD